MMNKPWVSFCISTFRRPVFLKAQLTALLQQSCPDFEVVISDNDPEGSGAAIVAALNDTRIKYFKNHTNLGMTRSFNKSIERSQTEFIVMVTDDDPIDTTMLQVFKNLMEKHPGYPIYCGCIRPGVAEGSIECFDGKNFAFQLLDPKKTTNFLWSSCVMKKSAVLNAGSMPDYGSPHLADHAMLALCSKDGGGLMLNKMYSSLTTHDANFSKSNLNLYQVACLGFHENITQNFQTDDYIKGSRNALKAHLQEWFIANIFTLRKYFTLKDPNPKKVAELNSLAREMLALPFMQFLKPLYYAKRVIFFFKRPLFQLKLLK